MAFRAILLTIVGVLVCAQPIGAAGAAKPAAATQIAASRNDGLTELTPLVRMRRLHLVRPDLIPYPIEIEVFC